MGPTKLIYWDSCALIKRYCDEEGSDLVRSLFKNKPISFTSIITHAEVLASFYRLLREGILSKIECRSAVRAFLADWPKLIVINYSSTAQSVAARLIHDYSLRGADLVHLASATQIADSGKKIEFITFDLKLTKAAKSAGALSVIEV